MQNQSEIGVEKMLTGQDVQSAEVMTSLQKADMAFRLLVQIRNKLMDAFQEINNIRV
jgi:flagellar hook-basal body complex protein FliE